MLFDREVITFLKVSITCQSSCFKISKKELKKKLLVQKQTTHCLFAHDITFYIEDKTFAYYQTSRNPLYPVSKGYNESL